jgi:hypothetical protein
MEESVAEGNTSGQCGDVPAEVEVGRFDRGAWFFGWIWAWAHGIDRVVKIDLVLTLAASFLGFLLLASLASWLDVKAGWVMWVWPPVGAAHFAWRVYMGRMGRRWAWQYRRFSSVAEFEEVQATWDWTGGIAILLLILAPMALFLVQAVARR